MLIKDFIVSYLSAKSRSQLKRTTSNEKNTVLLFYQKKMGGFEFFVPGKMLVF